MIRLTVNNNDYEFEKGISLFEVSKKFADDFKYEIIVGQVDGELHDLNYKLDNDSNLKFYDLSSHIGNKVYERGLLFLLIKAIKELYGYNIRACHSIDKGVFCEILDGSVLKEQIPKIKEQIDKYVNSNIPFIKGTYSKEDSINYFNKVGRLDKIESLKYVVKDNLVLYKFIDILDYFYGVMPINSSYIKFFDIHYLDDNSFVLLLPNIYIGGEIKPYSHYEGVFNSFRSFSNWAEKQGIVNVHDLNKEISFGRIQDLIYMNETNQNMRLYRIAEQIKSKEEIKLVLIAGPSSSGKTTTSKKLAIYLKSMGLKPQPLSVDDYFKERENSPKDKEGKYDFECVEAIDIDLFNDHLKKILNNEEVLIPTFNFVEGKKEYKNKIKLDKNGILIIEGLHALNDILTSSIENMHKFKIYISPLSTLGIDNSNRVSTTDLRLLRRMVRDNMNRGYNASKTLESWPSVRKGEEKYVFPFQNNNDVVFNTSLLYEFGVLKTYAEPLLFSVDREDKNYNEAIRLINLIMMVLPISGVEIPNDSILREFIGNSYFR